MESSLEGGLTATKLEKCPKCDSTDVVLHSNIVETTTNGWGWRVQCCDCKFTPPKSKWQWIDPQKAVEV